MPDASPLRMKYRPNKPVGVHMTTVHKNFGHDAKTGKPDPRNGWYHEEVDRFSLEDTLFGIQARELRTSRGLSLREAADATGLMLFEVSGLERGRGRVDDLDALRQCYETAFKKKQEST